MKLVSRQFRMRTGTVTDKRENCEEKKQKLEAEILPLFMQIAIMVLFF